MIALGFALFDSTIGRCAIAWSNRGVAGVLLPEVRELAMRGRLQRRFPQAREVAPPPAVQRVIDEIVALLWGEPSDLSTAALDVEGVAPFDRRVYEMARTIPPGATLTYGEIAARLGERGLARDVGRALGRNPFSIIVPCHRVIAAGGKPGGFSAHGGITTKLRMLSIERARTSHAPTLFENDSAFSVLSHR